MEKRVIGGVFLLISAICGLFEAGVLLVGSGAMALLNDMMGGALTICGAVLAIIAIITLLGAIMAIMGKMWGLALVGGIFGLLTIGPIFLGSIFGLIGLILIAMSKDEFGPKQIMPPGYYPPPGYAPPPGYQPPPPGYAPPPPQAPPPQ